MATKDILPDAEDAKMNMTPMIDMTFLLVVFFMLTIDLSSKEFIPVELPYATEGVEDKEDPLRDLMTKIWSPKRGEDGRAATIVVVKLEPLLASPEEILAAIRRHLHHV